MEANGTPGSGGAASDTSAGAGSGETGGGGRTLGQKLRLAAAALVAVVALVLVFQNQEPTQTRFLTWSVEMPRFALLGFVWLLGIATGWFLRRRRG